MVKQLYIYIYAFGKWRPCKVNTLTEAYKIAYGPFKGHRFVIKTREEKAYEVSYSQK